MEKRDSGECFADLKTAAKIYGFTTKALRVLAKRGEVPGAFQVPLNSPRGRWRIDLGILRKAWNGNGNH